MEILRQPRICSDERIAHERMTESEVSDSTGLICRAAQYLATWAERDSENKIVVETVPIMSMGVHRGNRGGFYTQGQACVSLLRAIMADGFDKTQANSQGIAVRQRSAINQGDKVHCHLLNVCRAIKTGRKWNITFDDSTGLAVCDHNGRLSATALAGHSNGVGWARYLKEGITVQVKVPLSKPR